MLSISTNQFIFIQNSDDSRWVASNPSFFLFTHLHNSFVTTIKYKWNWPKICFQINNCWAGLIAILALDTLARRPKNIIAQKKKMRKWLSLLDSNGSIRFRVAHHLKPLGTRHGCNNWSGSNQYRREVSNILWALIWFQRTIIIIVIGHAIMKTDMQLGSVNSVVRTVQEYCIS